MNLYDISIVLPSRGRPMRMKKAVLQINQVSPDVQIVLLVDNDDTATVQATSALLTHVRSLDVVVEKRLNAVEKWNLGAHYANGRCLVLGEDDLIFHTNWAEQALMALESIGGQGYVGLNSMNPNGEPAPSNYMVTLDWLIRYQGGALSIPIFSQCGNLATYELALRSGQCVWADGIHSRFDAQVENCHPYIPTEKGGSVPKASFDDTYELRKRQSESIQEQELYRRWLSQGCPITWGEP